jgi:hypothetical protein
MRSPHSGRLLDAIALICKMINSDHSSEAQSLILVAHRRFARRETS